MIVTVSFTIKVNGFDKEFDLKIKKKGSYSNQNILENVAHYIEHCEELHDIIGYS